ncbi:MAG: secondary thiamine-phosphate synthase enzyme YjbQ [Candidatus Thermoplasmatota archaeon]
MFKIGLKSDKRNQMVDITEKIKNVLEESNVEDGYIIVYVPHTTAGVTINEGADPDVKRDIIETLKKLVPESGDYRHAEGNSDAHIKSSLIGSSVNILIENNKLVLGTWQHIFFYEGDGPRNRKVYLNFVSK